MDNIRNLSQKENLEEKIASYLNKSNSTGQKLLYLFNIPLAISSIGLGAYYFVKGNEGGGAALGATGILLLIHGYGKKSFI